MRLKLLFLLMISALSILETTTIQAQDTLDWDLYQNFSPAFKLISQIIYAPYDTVRISVNCQWYPISPLFRVKVLRVKDPELFLLAQKSRPIMDMVGKDSSNLLKYCEEIESFEKRLSIGTSVNNQRKYYYLNDVITYIPRN